MISYITKEKTMRKLPLINKESKAGFLSAKEKELLQKILLDAFQNIENDVAIGRRFTVSDIYEKVSNANAINFDYEDVDYLAVEEK
jgi:hypothetical protein